MAELMMKGSLGILLLITALQDIRTKKVSLWIIGAGAVIVCALVPFTHSISVIDRGVGILVGLGVMITSRATGGKIGMGDGYLLCVTGISFGFWGNMELFATALFAAALVSIVLLAFRLADRKKSIPFIPFLFLAYLIRIIITKAWLIA